MVWFGMPRARSWLGRVVAAARERLARAQLPLRVHLAIFAGLLLVPAFLLSAVLLREAANERRREVEGRLLQLANDLSVDISNELERSITVLRTLSYSATLREQALEAFYRQTFNLTGDPDSFVLLLKPDGQQLVNTGVPWGTLLPPYSEPDALQRAVESMQPVVTDLIFSRLRQRYVVNVLFPVLEQGTVTFVLALSITPQRIVTLLQSQDLGPDWTTGVVDQRGVVIARSRDPELYVGRKVPTHILDQDQKQLVVHPASSINGQRILRAATRTRISQWQILAAVSEDHVNLLAFRAIQNLIIGCIIILGLAGLLVALYGRELAASFTSVTRAMQDSPKDTMVREASDAAGQLRQASQALRDSEERFRGIFQNAATGIALAGLDERYVACNPAFARIAGYPQEHIIGRTYTDLIYPEDRAENYTLTQRLLRGEIPYFEIENRYQANDHRVIWVQKHISLIRDGSGRPTGILTLVTDMTDRRENERALAIALERSRIAQQTAHAALYEHADEARLFYDEAFRTVTGFSPGEAASLPQGHRALIHHDDTAKAHTAMEAGLASGDGYDISYRLRHKSGRHVWVHDRASVLPGGKATGGRIIGMLFDISEQKTREEHIHLLLREVNHRSKNMLGLVQAIARQTVSNTPAEFLTRFGERIQALSANQDLLVRNEWGGIDLEELIEAQLAHMASMPNPRIILRGPRLHVSPAAAQVIGMVMHELATNASKYGALSDEAGRIEIVWEVREGGQFQIAWRENGGPAVTPPARLGFGSTVVGAMARMGLEAEVTHEFAPEGVAWTLISHLSKVLDHSTLPAQSAPRLTGERALPKPDAPRVLVVEDEALIALELMETLMAHGYAPFGPARSATDALALLSRERCDAAILDVTLGHETAEPVARALYARRVPFVVASGYEASQLPPELQAAPFLRKPVDAADLIEALRASLGTAAPP